MKKRIKIVIVTVICIVVVWTASAVTDYIRSQNLKAPLFAVSMNLDQNGAGVYHCIGYDVVAVSGTFNRGENVLYDMHFMLLGRGNNRRKSLSDNYHGNYGLLGDDEEVVLRSLEALKFVTPDESGDRKTYTEYVRGNDVKIMNLILYNDVVAGVEYEYNNLEAAYNYAKKLRNDLEMTYGEKTTYPGMTITDKDYFDNINDITEIKAQYRYYEDWMPGFDYQKEENVKKMFDGNEYSRINVHFELYVVDANKSTVSVRYIALP